MSTGDVIVKLGLTCLTDRDTDEWRIYAASIHPIVVGPTKTAAIQKLLLDCIADMADIEYLRYLVAWTTARLAELEARDA